MVFWKIFPSILILNLFWSKPISSVSLSSTELSEIPTNFLNHAKKPELVNWMVHIRRRIHENPELGFEEFETSMIGSGEPPFVSIRADMDALSMQGFDWNHVCCLLQESVEWEHKSKVPGKMHACGHDASWCCKNPSRSSPRIEVFQPGEEGAGGAKKMVEEGVLDNIDAIFGLHVSSDLPIGSVASRPGALLAGSGSFEAHTIDPIVAASSVIVSLQHLGSREADPLDSQVSALIYVFGLIITLFCSGCISWKIPRTFNVIPDSVTIGGTFRAFSAESFVQLKKRIEEIFFPVTANNKVLHKHFENVAGDMLGTANVKNMHPLMGSEDFFVGLNMVSVNHWKPT
ncbi:hypothetical protein MKX03_020315 [Papaver bracteatum]|nr:hypothetical protein MKX03_020315 [Papaver bracteatum]